MLGCLHYLGVSFLLFQHLLGKRGLRTRSSLTQFLTQCVLISVRSCAWFLSPCFYCISYLFCFFCPSLQSIPYLCLIGELFRDYPQVRKYLKEYERWMHIELSVLLDSLELLPPASKSSGDIECWLWNSSIKEYLS